MVIRLKTKERKEGYQTKEFSEEIFTTWKGDYTKELYLKISEADLYYSQEGSPNFDIIFRSKTQEHGFNYPFQIGTNGNDPNFAETSSVSVQPGDIVILGTDGVFDNLYSISVLNTLENLWQQSQQDFTSQNIADALAKRAFDLSLDQNYFSPFSMNAILNAGMLFRGGKSDDITVSVGIVN